MGWETLKPRSVSVRVPIELDIQVKTLASGRHQARTMVGRAEIVVTSDTREGAISRLEHTAQVAFTSLLSKAG